MMMPGSSIEIREVAGLDRRFEPEALPARPLRRAWSNISSGTNTAGWWRC